MVDAVVSFVVERLGDLLIEQVVLLRGVENDVKWLKEKLKWMLSFLTDAEENLDVDHRMRQWISDIRDVAYEAEDIIDNFILKVEEEGGATPKKKMGLKDCFKKYFYICSKQGNLSKQAHLYGIGKEINALKDKLNEIQRNKEIFNTGNIGEARAGSNRMNETINWLRREHPYEDKEHIVGFKEDANKLMFELIREVKDRYVISIVGPGGLGKTTIARKLYNTLSSTEKFDCYGWVSVSNDYNIQDLLRATIKSFKKEITKEEFSFFEKMNKDDLESYLRDYLKGRRYLVVLDDVWDINSWESLRRAFPNENNGNRVIMTTRKRAVAEHCDERTYVHELPFLNEEESWELFCSKAFPNYDSEAGNIKGRCLPTEEINLAREMLSKCSGLPLAIVVLGGLLRRTKPDEWPKLKKHIWRHLKDDSIHVQHVVALSFNELPYFLKSCFLYMGLFPEDFGIDAETLCRLWVAEGFIKHDEEPFEEKAEEYLKELINRSLIQVVERNWRRITTCRVHDLVRDFAIEKSKELNFLHIYEGSLAPNSRRLASHSGFQRFVSLDHSDLRLRTLLFFNVNDESMETAQLQSLCRKFRLLRVLDLVDIQFNPPQDREKTRLPDEIGKLIHLRYLNFDTTRINELSPFIGNLHALQTLIISSSSIDLIQLPDEICNAKQLRHLVGRLKRPFPVDQLTNLRTLNCIFTMEQDQMEFNSMSLINLRELHVYYRGNGPITISGLRSIESLVLRVIASVDRSLPISVLPTSVLHSLSQCQHLVQLRLHISRPWKLPTEVREFPPSLKYLNLSAIQLGEDPMPMLEKLPKLTILILRNYHGEKLACTARGFPQLEILQLMDGYAEEFQVEEGAMPALKGFLLVDFRVQSVSDRLRSVPKPHPPLNTDEWAY